MKVLTQDEIQDKRFLNFKRSIEQLNYHLRAYLNAYSFDEEIYESMRIIYSEGIINYSGEPLGNFLGVYPRWSDFEDLPFGNFSKWARTQNWSLLIIGS